MKLIRNHYPISVFACLSIIMHFCILIVFVLFHSNRTIAPESIDFRLRVIPLDLTENSAPHHKPEIEHGPEARKFSKTVPESAPENSETVHSLLFKPAPNQNFIIASVDSPSVYKPDNKDTTRLCDDQFQKQLFNELSSIKYVQPAKDRTASWVDTRNHGGSLIKASEGGMFTLRDTRTRMKGKPRFNFIPNKTEAKIIMILSNDSAQSTMEIYHRIASLSLTLSGLEQHLKHLFDKGLLIQNKISPENKFSFFGMPIELSSTNRKNPVYEYTLRIKREKMIARVESHQLWLTDQLIESDPDSSALIYKILNIDSVLSILRTYKPNDHSQPLE